MTTDLELDEIRRDVLEEFASTHGRKAVKQLLDEIADDLREEYEGAEAVVALEAIQKELEHFCLNNCESCDKPEVDHIWLSESELNEWRPQEGFKKNSCARKPKPGSTEHPLELIFKVWSPPEDPCDSAFMEEIST